MFVIENLLTNEISILSEKENWISDFGYKSWGTSMNRI
jgi:hypothetical protein